MEEVSSYQVIEGIGLILIARRYGFEGSPSLEGIRDPDIRKGQQ